MDMRNLKKYLLDEVTSHDVLKEISAEVELFRTSRLKKGASCAISGTHEDFRFIFNNSHVRKLCRAYLEGQFNAWELEYLCNLIELSEAFLMENDDVEDAVFLLSSPDVNGEINRKVVQDILGRL